MVAIVAHRLTGCLALSAVFLFAPMMADAHDFTGVFHGQGTGCWGGLYVRTKSIQWTTPYSICGPTRYEIIGKKLKKKLEVGNYVVFSLKEKSNLCRYKIIGLYFYSQSHAYGTDWVAAGFQNRQDYKRFTPSDILSDKPAPSSILLCDMPDQTISY